MLKRKPNHMELSHINLLPSICRGTSRLVSTLAGRRLMKAFDSTDKQGGFIGSMYIGGNNVAVELVREGLASVHSFSADGLPFGRELTAAEEEAKNAKKNVRFHSLPMLIVALGRLHWRRSRGQGG